MPYHNTQKPEDDSTYIITSCNIKKRFNPLTYWAKTTSTTKTIIFCLNMIRILYRVKRLQFLFSFLSIAFVVQENNIVKR